MTPHSKALCVRAWYLVLSSAAAAADPGVSAESLREVSANVLTHVESQQRDFPREKGISVIPSGLFRPLYRDRGARERPALLLSLALGGPSR